MRIGHSRRRDAGNEGKFPRRQGAPESATNRATSASCDAKGPHGVSSRSSGSAPSQGVRLQRFDNDRTIHDIDSSIAAELNLQNHRYKVALIRDGIN